MQLIMLTSTKNLTISLGIAKLQAENATDFGLIMAGASLAAIPIIVIFLIFQKYFTKGITMGAVKGQGGCYDLHGDSKYKSLSRSG